MSAREARLPHKPDYIARTIETVRNHKDADNCWPQWANIFADQIEALDARVAALVAERDALREVAEAAEQVKRACFPDDRQAWTVQERRLAAALAGLGSQ